MDWFLYDNGLRHERVNVRVSWLKIVDKTAWNFIQHIHIYICCMYIYIYICIYIYIYMYIYMYIYINICIYMYYIYMYIYGGSVGQAVNIYILQRLWTILWVYNPSTDQLYYFSTISKWVVHYKMLMYIVHRERSVELPILTFFGYFPFFSPPFRIFEHIKYFKNHESQKNIRSYNTVFETTSNYSF